ncbi:MAG: hypothetical protein GY762_00615 [Proteobacteria bacterium]|nr:hypothetical protein [Pseudomonadota bacterium]
MKSRSSGPSTLAVHTEFPLDADQEDHLEAVWSQELENMELIRADCQLTFHKGFPDDNTYGSFSKFIPIVYVREKEAPAKQ